MARQNREIVGQNLAMNLRPRLLCSYACALGNPQGREGDE